MFPKTTVSTPLSVIIFIRRPFPYPTFTGARGARHHGYNIHITEFKFHISYLRNHDSTLMLYSIIFTCHSFQPSSISLLRVGNTFSITSPFDVTKLQKNCLDVSSTSSFPFPNVNGHAYSYPLPPLW